MKLINFDVEDAGMTSALVTGYIPALSDALFWRYPLGTPVDGFKNYVMLGGLKGFDMSPDNHLSRSIYSVKRFGTDIVVYNETVQTTKTKGILFAGVKAKDGVHLQEDMCLVSQDGRLFDKIEVLAVGGVPLLGNRDVLNAVLVCPEGLGYTVGNQVFCAVTGLEVSWGRHVISVTSLVKQRSLRGNKKRTLVN